MLSAKKLTYILVAIAMIAISSNANAQTYNNQQQKPMVAQVIENQQRRMTKSVPDWFKDMRMTYLLMQKRMQKPEYQEYINSLEQDNRFQRDLAKNMSKVGTDRMDSSFDKQNDKKLEVMSRQYLSIY